MSGIGESILSEMMQGTQPRTGDPAFIEATLREVRDNDVLAEGGGMGPATLSVGKFFEKDKYRGALMWPVQGDMPLGRFYDGMMGVAKRLGLPTPQIDKVMGSFQYGGSKRDFLYFEVAYDDEKDVLDTMAKAKAAKAKLLIVGFDNLAPEVQQAAKDLKATIQKR